MDPDRQDPTARAALDDAAIAAMVRDVADDWHMPPQRLDEVTWRDRVGRGLRAGGGGSRVRWSRRLFAGATLALVATVSLSFAAVWLTAPRGDQGAVVASGSPSPDASPTVGPSRRPVPVGTPLPRLVQNGDLPTPSRVMVLTGQSYRVVDLATGTLGPESLQAFGGRTTVLARPGGGWVCICGDGMSPRAVQLSLLRVDPNGVSPDAPEAHNGNVTAARRLKDIQGTFDPNESMAVQPWIADATVTTSPDGRFALLGWIYRDGAAGWVTGVDVLDLETLEITSSQSLTLDEPAAVDGRGRVRTAPVATISADGSTMLLSSVWYMDDPNNPTPLVGTDHWTNGFVDGVIGPGTSQPGFLAAGSSTSAECRQFDAGPIDKESYYTLCMTPAGRFELARIRVDGTTIDTTELPRDDPAPGTPLTTRTEDAVFMWNPVARTITRFDFTTGAVTTGQGQTASAPDGLVDRLAALGRHIGHLIAPSAVAKDFLEPGIVASPDGSRIFALGVSGEDGIGGSTGVYAFDSTTLDSIGHWNPTADYSSIAINADGTAVYASAPGGIARDGSGSPDNGASVTVFDSADGQVLLLAGQIGQPGTHDLWFTESVLR